jgi:hypothetical protein
MEISREDRYRTAQEIRMPSTFSTTRPPVNKFRELFTLTITPPPTGFTKLLENIDVLAAVPAVQDHLRAAAQHPRLDAVTSDLIFTLERVPGGETRVIFWYQYQD